VNHRNDKAFVVFAVGRGWFGGFAAKPAPSNISPSLTHCHSERNEMKPRLNARLNNEVGQGRAGNKSQSKRIFL